MTHQQRHADDATSPQTGGAQAQREGFGLGWGTCSPSGQLYEADVMLRVILGLSAEGALPSLMSLAADHGEAGDLLDWLTERDEPGQWTLTLASGRRALLLRTASARAQGVRQIELLAQAVEEPALVTSPFAAMSAATAPAASAPDTLRIQRAETIERVISGVAHDINNQLMVLMSGVYLLQSQAAMQALDMQAALQEMIEATQRMSELSGSLQALARDDGSQRVTFDLSHRVHLNRKLLLRAVGPQVSTSFALDARAGAVLMTEEGWASLLINVAWGARRVLGRAGGWLLIQTAPRAQLRISLRAPDEALDVDAEAALSEQPLCCGAMTLRALCEVLNVHAELSAPGELTFHLPQGARKPAPAAPEPQGEGVAQRVLLVIHADQVREALARLLIAARHVVTSSRSAGDALLAAELAGSPFDVIVADVALPVLDGLALVERLRRGTPSLRAVLFGDVPTPSPPSLIALPWPCDLPRILAALTA
jgi:CheY-like chemotaxis protein